MLKTARNPFLVRVLLVLLILAFSFVALCSPASAASYATKSGTLNGYSCSSALYFGSSTYNANGSTTYGTTASSVYISITYTYKQAGTETIRTISNHRTNANSTGVALTVSPTYSCSGNISASSSTTITAKNGAIWNPGTLSIS